MDAAHNTLGLEQERDGGVPCSALLGVHARKWDDVCEELKLNHPASNVTLWASGYVFGLKHAADMASRSESGAANVKPQCTPTPQAASRGVPDAQAIAIVMGYEAMRICLGHPTRCYSYDEVMHWMKLMKP